MKSFINRYGHLLLSVLFALGVLLFWAVPYAAALSYQEEHQLFLFGNTYFLDRISIPGGLSDYISEFLVQFYYIPVLGAVVLGLLFFFLQRLTAILFCRMKVHSVWYPLSFIPVILLWAYMGNENVLLSFAFSLLVAEGFFFVYLVFCQSGAKKWRGNVCLLVVLPLFYWFFGACVWMIVAFVILYDLYDKGIRSLNLLRGLCIAIYVNMIVLCCAQFLPYPLYKLYGGINYFRYPGFIPWMQWGVMAAFVFIPFIADYLSAVKLHKKLRMQGLLITVLLVSGGCLVRYSYRPLTYTMIDYDYLVRNHQWQKILDKARGQTANTPFGVSCVNYALAMTGQLNDHLFEYYQNGAEGLFPSFVRDMTSPVPTSDIFYSLGMINDAERYAFEAQEAIPNYRKSGRLMQRMIQCEIVNGNYRVADKYLRMLRKSLFYHSWAERQMQLSGNDRAVNADPEYRRLRDLRIKHTDYLFSDREMDQMLGLLIIDNKKYNNKMAYEYLIAYELLQKDLKRFMEYYPLGQYFVFTHIPYNIQQVLIGLWVQEHGTLQGMPYSVDQQNTGETTAFMRTYVNNRNDPSLQKPPLCYNAWHYILMTGSKKQRKKMMREIY